MEILLNGENAFDDIYDVQENGTLKQGKISKIGVLPKGTEGGRPTVMMQVMVEGKPVAMQMTLRMFQTVNSAFMSYYGDVTDGCALELDGKQVTVSWKG